MTGVFITVLRIVYIIQKMHRYCSVTRVFFRTVENMPIVAFWCQVLVRGEISILLLFQTTTGSLSGTMSAAVRQIYSKSNMVEQEFCIHLLPYSFTRIAMSSYFLLSQVWDNEYWFWIWCEVYFYFMCLNWLAEIQSMTVSDVRILEWKRCYGWLVQIDGQRRILNLSFQQSNRERDRYFVIIFIR